MTKMQLGKVLVTGASGLMGSYVVAELTGKADIVGFDIVAPKDPSTIGRFVQGNIEDIDSVREAVAGCDAVIHVAARPNIWSGTPHRLASFLFALQGGIERGSSFQHRAGDVEQAVGY